MGPFIKQDTDTDTGSRQLCDLFKWLPVMDYGSPNGHTYLGYNFSPCFIPAHTVETIS